MVGLLLGGALTETAGMLGSGAFYLAAILAAAVLLRPRATDRPAQPSRRPVTSATREPS